MKKKATLRMGPLYFVATFGFLAMPVAEVNM